MANKPELVKLYFRIGEVAEIVGVRTHVLRYWETEFAMLNPQKSSRGQRVYSRKDVEKLLTIRDLLHTQGFTIAGARKRLRGGYNSLQNKLKEDADKQTVAAIAPTAQLSTSTSSPTQDGIQAAESASGTADEEGGDTPAVSVRPVLASEDSSELVASASDKPQPVTAEPSIESSSESSTADELLAVAVLPSKVEDNRPLRRTLLQVRSELRLWFQELSEELSFAPADGNRGQSVASVTTDVLDPQESPARTIAGSTTAGSTTAGVAAFAAVALGGEALATAEAVSRAKSTPSQAETTQLSLSERLSTPEDAALLAPAATSSKRGKAAANTSRSGLTRLGGEIRKADASEALVKELASEPVSRQWAPRFSGQPVQEIQYAATALPDAEMSRQLASERALGARPGMTREGSVEDKASAASLVSASSASVSSVSTSGGGASSGNK